MTDAWLYEAQFRTVVTIWSNFGGGLFRSPSDCQPVGMCRKNTRVFSVHHDVLGDVRTHVVWNAAVVE